MKKNQYLSRRLKHIGIKTTKISDMMDSFSSMAFQSRNLWNAARIYDMMLRDRNCSVILCLAGSIFSAGLKTLVYEMIQNNMVDAIVSTGAVIVDQDFFEALGFYHYIGTPASDDEHLRQNHIDRIYDTYIDEDELRVCDDTVGLIADRLKPRPYSSREFIIEMGKYLTTHTKKSDSVVLAAYKKGVPIFVPAFSDSSAGFGLIKHQYANPKKHVSIDSAKDFLELTKLKMAAKQSGLFMIGGGVPKNFAQDIVVAAEVIGFDAPMHKYAIQVTVADVRDGALSGSTLKEASSWGKVDTTYEQMVFAEATLAVPLIAGCAYHEGAWRAREARRWNQSLESLTV